MPTVQVGGHLPDAQYRPTGKKPPVVYPFNLAAARLTRAGSSTKDHVIPEYTPISDQGPTSTCVANAVCDSCEILLGAEHGEGRVVQLSRLFLYWVARKTHEATGEDKGTYIKAATWQLQELGVPEEKYFPFSTKLEVLTSSPPLEAFTIASENRVTGSLSITAAGAQRLEQIETSIRADHPVVFATTVDTPFMQFRGRDVVGPPTALIRGSHAMIVTGVRHAKTGSREFLIRNSWGSNWGYQGHAWVTESFLGRRETSDLWVLTRMPVID